ncbi:NAD-dependent protein deacetylase Sirt2 [Eumeta japonica]|uniref:NAD-dependent protein deacetylase Sirt2 n=1 Tax=Eumeta variegata TaxID=151549 RepID=A0A4C1TPJ2_EUMVA|nr:NAD-dependent protein deacetylase Sirt2 [Eumeta japonica]
MVGAGISTSAGIPDFRSPGSGLYDNLQKYNLPHPSAIFEMDYFEENLSLFCFGKRTLPGSFNPTPSHYFVRLLHNKEVQPFASLIDRANSKCVRLLINRTKVGNDFGGISSWFMSGPGLMFDNPKNTRDIAYIGDCDDGCLALAESLGWKDELQNLIKTEHARLDKENSKHTNTSQNNDDDKLLKEAEKSDS